MKPREAIERVPVEERSDMAEFFRQGHSEVTSRLARAARVSVATRGEIIDEIIYVSNHF